MLVYANNFHFIGADCEGAAFKAVGAWLKEQLGRGLHPTQLKKDGAFEGEKSGRRSWLKVRASVEELPHLYSYVLTTQDETPGRHWITEIGIRDEGESLNLSCVLRTDEQSTLVENPVRASRPRLIAYLVNNIRKAARAEFAPTVCGVELKAIGGDEDSYESLRAEIERPERDCAIVLVSPTVKANYLVDARSLQDLLVGLAQVVEITTDFNSYQMSGVLGESRSAWNGAVNIIYPRNASGFVRSRLFLSSELSEMGTTEYEIASRLLAWTTYRTNIPRLRRQIRPETVSQFALQRRMRAAFANSEKMSAVQLRCEMKRLAEQSTADALYFDEIVNENAQLQARLSDLSDKLEEANDLVSKQKFDIEALKDRLEKAGPEAAHIVASSSFIPLIVRASGPTPLECLDLIETLYSDKCQVLNSARDSARKSDQFSSGRELLHLLNRLTTEYRDKLLAGGDSEARKVFGKSEFSATESETVSNNKRSRRERTFTYEGVEIQMLRHLKIGADDDVTRTIRVHFHWDSPRKLIVIGHCGMHLYIPGR